MKTSEMFPKKEWPGASFEDVNAAALNAYPGLLQRWFPAGRVQGHEFVVGNVNGDKGRSLSINTTTGVWSDFGDGNHGGSDPVSLYAARCRIGQGEACKRLAGELGLSTNHPTQTPAPKVKPHPEWNPTLPAPTPPPHHPHHPRLGQPSQVWQYNNRDGQLLFLVCRFDRADGGKDIMPLSYGVLDGKEGWHWKAIPDQRPLYGLDRLQASPQAKVLLVEGEKTADAAQRLLPALVAVSWAGGGKAASKTDWSPLKDREVVVWPDADKPGRETAEGWHTPHGEFKHGLVHYLSDVGAVVRVVEPPPNVKDGWDLADAEVEGWDTERVIKWIKENMREASQPSGPIPAASLETVSPAAANAPSQPTVVTEWPDPDLRVLDGGRQAPVDYPLEAFGDFWADWVSKTAEGCSAPADYVAAGLLGTASALIGNARWASPWKSWSEPPVLWLVCVGAPSSGKTPGMETPLALVSILEKEMAVSFKETLKEHETAKEIAVIARENWKSEAKQATKKGVAAPEMPDAAMIPEDLKRPRIYTSDATMEAIGILLAAEPRGVLMYADELACWLSGHEKYGSGSSSDRPFWNKAFNGHSHQIDRVKRPDPISISHLSVPVLGGIQPDKIKTAFIDHADDGLASRFLTFWPESIPPKKPNTAVDNVDALTALRRLHGLPMSEDDNGDPAPLSVRFANDAADSLQQFRLANYGDGLSAAGLYESHLGKFPGIAIRLALVLEYLWWSVTGGSEPQTVSAEAANYAIHLIESYFKPMARRTYGDAAIPEREKDAAGITRIIRRDKPAVVNRRTVQRDWHLPGLRDDGMRVSRAFEFLEETGWVRQIQAGGLGRPRADYEVNPTVLLEYSISTGKTDRTDKR